MSNEAILTLKISKKTVMVILIAVGCFTLGFFMGAGNPTGSSDVSVVSLIYASIGASIVSALASIICLMQLSRGM